MIKNDEEYHGEGILKFEGKEVIGVKVNTLFKQMLKDIPYPLTLRKKFSKEVYWIELEFDISDKRFTERRDEIDEIVTKIGLGQAFELDLHLAGVEETLMLDAVYLNKKGETLSPKVWPTRKFLCRKETVIEIY